MPLLVQSMASRAGSLSTILARCGYIEAEAAELRSDSLYRESLDYLLKGAPVVRFGDSVGFDCSRGALSGVRPWPAG